MFGKEFKIGISFTADHAQIAVLAFRKEEITIAHLEEVENDHLGEHWFLQPLVSATNKIYKKTKGVSLSLDNASIIAHLFPMDTSLTREEQHEQTMWELSNVISGFNPKEYVLDIHMMKIRAHDHLADMFVVAARKSAVMNIRSKLGDHDCRLETADINFFGGQYSLLVNYPEVRTKSIALIEIGEHRIDMGSLVFGRLSAFRYKLASTPEECVAAIKEFLDKQRLTEIYLHGTGLSLQTQDAIAQQVTLPLVRINPFRRMQVSRKIHGFDAIAGQEHRFASAVGVALRKE